MKKAILVEINYAVRLVIDENTTEDQIAERTAKKITDKIMNKETNDNIISIIEDDECPYGTFDDD